MPRNCAIAACAGSMSRSIRSIPRNSPRSPAAAGSTRCSKASRRRRRAGLAVKINTVALRGVNEDELDDLVAWCGAEGLRSRLHRGHADGRYRRREPARPIPAAVVGALPAAAPLDARRERLPHRRPGALCDGARDRPAARLHHAADPQFLRELQPRPADLHRHALYVPRAGGCGGSAHAAAPIRKRRGGRGGDPRGDRRASPRATISSSTAATTGPPSPAI